MKKFQLKFDTDDENTFQAIAIYTDEIDFRLAYLLNLHLSIQLKKSSDLYVKRYDTSFAIYDYDDKQHNRSWLLLNNYSLIQKEVTYDFDLFGEATLFSQKITYLKTYKKAKYILKINADDISEILPKILNDVIRIPQIYTAESIDLTNERNKKRLTF